MGDIHYVTRDGIVKTSLGSGDGVVHSGGLIYAVSGFEGTRYILFLMGEKKKENEIFKDFATPMLQAGSYCHTMQEL
jgi:hypothetical protein